LFSLQEFTAKLNLRPGMKVLDIGCGIGGSAFYLARTYKVPFETGKFPLRIYQNNYGN
jgi:cyclopropane fatty-acyl-phospholipid synthase-like methyltransferase